MSLVCARAHTHTYIRTSTHASTRTHARTHACTHASTHARTHTYKHTPLALLPWVKRQVLCFRDRLKMVKHKVLSLNGLKRTDEANFQSEFHGVPRPERRTAKAMPRTDLIFRRNHGRTAPSGTISESEKQPSSSNAFQNSKLIQHHH